MKARRFFAARSRISLGIGSPRRHRYRPSLPGRRHPGGGFHIPNPRPIRTGPDCRGRPRSHKACQGLGSGFTRGGWVNVTRRARADAALVALELIDQAGLGSEECSTALLEALAADLSKDARSRWIEHLANVSDRLESAAAVRILIAAMQREKDPNMSLTRMSKLWLRSLLCHLEWPPRRQLLFSLPAWSVPLMRSPAATWRLSWRR